MPDRSIFEIIDYCKNNKWFYPSHIKACLGITESKSIQYFSECKKDMKITTNYIQSKDFINWYYSKNKISLPTR